MAALGYIEDEFRFLLHILEMYVGVYRNRAHNENILYWGL